MPSAFLCSRLSPAAASASRDRAVSYPDLSDIDGTSFTVENGGQLSLLGVTTVNDSPTATTNWNVYAGSLISLPNLTTIDNGPISIGAYDSGQGVSGRFARLAAGYEPHRFWHPRMARERDLSARPDQRHRPTKLDGTDDAAIAAPNLTTFDDSSLTISGEQATYQSLSNIDKSDLDVSGGGSLTLPEVTAYGAPPPISRAARLGRSPVPGACCRCRIWPRSTRGLA